MEDAMAETTCIHMRVIVETKKPNSKIHLEGAVSQGLEATNIDEFFSDYFFKDLSVNFLAQGIEKIEEKNIPAVFTLLANAAAKHVAGQKGQSVLSLTVASELQTSVLRMDTSREFVCMLG